jgi:hypothetical protein
MNAKVRNIQIDSRMADYRSPEALAEDARRLVEFEQTRVGVPWSEIKDWMDTWGTASELPPPTPRKL